MGRVISSEAAVEKVVTRALREQPIVDMHTHLYPPVFGTPFGGHGGKSDAEGLLLWGLDELLTYHYLVAEVFRVVPATELSYEAFWRMPKSVQAEHIWKHLFVERTPLSEACRGVLTSLRLGSDHCRSSPGELASDLELSSGAMTSRIDRLEQAGYVRRLPDLDDRRGVVVELTQKGREAWDTSINVQGRREAFIASVLTKEEQRQLNHLLRKLLLGFGDEKGTKKERS